MVMDQSIASSAIAKQKKINSRNELFSQTQQQHEQQKQEDNSFSETTIFSKQPDHSTAIIHNTGNPNQVRGIRSTYVMKRYKEADLIKRLD